MCFLVDADDLARLTRCWEGLPWTAQGTLTMLRLLASSSTEPRMIEGCGQTGNRFFDWLPDHFFSARSSYFLEHLNGQPFLFSPFALISVDDCFSRDSRTWDLDMLRCSVLPNILHFFAVLSCSSRVWFFFSTTNQNVWFQYDLVLLDLLILTVDRVSGCKEDRS